MRRQESRAPWMRFHRSLTWAILRLGLCSWPCMCLAMTPPTSELAKDHRALLPVVVGTGASAATKAAASDLAQYLGRMSGAEFQIETGHGSQGIVLGCPTDFARLPTSAQFDSGPFEREVYVLRSHPQGLYLLGATDLAVTHAVWDLLYRLGYRQFFPGETWEVVPNVSHLRIAVDDRQAWARQYNRPLYLGEFGAYDKGDMASRVRWTSFVTRSAEKLGWSWAYWQFDGDFIVYDMKEQKWVEPLRDALIPRVN